MSDLDVNVVSFETFLEDSKSISDANHSKKNGDQTADKLAEPSEHKSDKNGICTDKNQSKANKLGEGDKAADTLKEDKEEIEGDQKVGSKKDQLDDGDDSDDDSDDDDDKKDKSDDSDDDEGDDD